VLSSFCKLGNYNELKKLVRLARVFCVFIALLTALLTYRQPATIRQFLNSVLPAGDMRGRMQRNMDIVESRRNGPQPSMRHDDDDDDDDDDVLTPLHHYYCLVIVLTGMSAN